jgi:hypothetical protein
MKYNKNQEENQVCWVAIALLNTQTMVQILLSLSLTPHWDMLGWFLDYDLKRMCQWSLPIIQTLPVTTEGHYQIPSGQSVSWLTSELKISPNTKYTNSYATFYSLHIQYQTSNIFCILFLASITPTSYK